MSEEFDFEDYLSDDGALASDEEATAGEARSVAMSLDGYTYATLVGFDEEIARLRELGVLDGHDDDYLAFVEQMKAQHGLYDEPTGNTVVFQSAAREDADRLMIATANELGCPIMRMKMLDNPGVSVETALGATVVLILAGTLAGIFPALQAAKVKPIEALRAE